MADEPESGELERRGSNRAVAVIALLSGLLATLGALIVPFLPVKAQTADLVWPGQLVGNVNAPLLSYFPEQFNLLVPCSAATTLPAQSADAHGATPAGGAVLFATIPKASSLATTRGLVVLLTGPAQARSLQIVLRGETLLVVPAAQLAEPGCKAIIVRASRAGTHAELQGLPGFVADRPGADLRPQITGFYTDLAAGPGDPQLAGISARATLDTRFITSPTKVKFAVLTATATLILIALAALALLDRIGSETAATIAWRRLLTPRPADVVVTLALALWHVIGANTADDGYIATLVKAGRGGGYFANYYRYFGVPDDPWGWFYRVLGLMADTGESSPWLRLPALFINFATWVVLSRAVLPRIFSRASKTTALIAGWTAMLVFLTFVFAYDNGLRPEPWIALGIISSWALVERAVATEQFLLVGFAGVVASATLTCGPSGMIAYFPMVLAAKPLIEIGKRRVGAISGDSAKRLTAITWIALLAPIAAALASASLIGFWQISYGDFQASSAIKMLVGPYLHWWEELARYQGLMGFSPDGAFSRRFPMLVMLLALVVAATVLWRVSITTLLGRETAVDFQIEPSRRLIGLVFVGLLCLMFTPTKPTHHFGAFAGVGAAATGVGAAAVLAIATARARAVFAAAALFLLGVTYTAPNDWWYPAGYGAPFRTTAIRLGVSLGTVFYYLAILTLAGALFLHLVGRSRILERTLLAKRLIASCFALGAALTVVAELAATTVQALTVDYSSGARNLSAVTGGSECGLADEILVDTDPNRSILRPVSQAGSSAAELIGDGARGFAITSPNDPITEVLLAQANLPEVPPSPDPIHPVPPADPADLVGFGLDPRATPLVISATNSPPPIAELTSHWYQLPERTSLVTIAAAGYFQNSVVQMEFADSLPATEAQHPPAKGPFQIRPVIAADIPPGWRDLRVSDIPAGAKAVRIKLRLDVPGPNQWIALTPPRAPKLATLQEVIGKTAPVLADWDTGLGFPCLRPFGYRDGIMELAQYRISPDRVTDAAFARWMDARGGGPLGVIEAVEHAVTMPTYLRGALDVDWGKAQRLIPLVTGTKPDVVTGSVKRSGFDNPGPLGSGLAGSSWKTDSAKLN